MKHLQPEKLTQTEPSNNTKLFIFSLYALSLIIFGFCLNSPKEILEGLFQIITSPDTLISDYMGVGNQGAAFVNAGLLALLLLGIFHQLKLPMTGVSLACLFTVTGVGFFGKNLFNIWFIFFGVFLYAKVQKEPFYKYAYKAFYGAALAPVTTEILFSSTSSNLIKIPLAIILGITIGFILSPIADNLLRVHQGYSLYNMGFTAGVIGVIVVALLTSYGIVPIPQTIWTSNNKTIFALFLLAIFLSMILLALFFNRNSWQKMNSIVQYSGQSPTDFIQLVGFAPSLMNMGINGLIATCYILGVGGDLNGPTIGGIITLAGFSAFGKHPKNILPILLGIYLGTLAKPWNANDPSMLLTALFGTNLAPIAGQYGIFWGVITGFIHSSVVLAVGSAHGGLNLYNNGFAAGIVAATILPVIRIFSHHKN